MLRFASVSAVMLLFASVPQVAIAQSRGAPVTQGITSGELAVSVEEVRQRNVELGTRYVDLETEVAEMRGRIETLEFLLSQSREQVNQMQEDDAAIARLIDRLEGRLTAQAAQIDGLKLRLDAAAESGFDLQTETRPVDDDIADIASIPSGSETSVQPRRLVMQAAPQQEPMGEPMQTGLPQGTLGTLPASALPGEAGPLFAEAKSRLLRFDFEGAETAFRSFLDAFGDDPQAGEAHYWLGEALYQQEAHAEAGQAYTKMIREYPDDPRAPEALAKLARSMRLVGNLDQACNALNLMNQRYPEVSGVTRNLAAGERVRSGCDS